MAPQGPPHTAALEGPVPRQQTRHKPETLAREDPPGKTDGSGTSLTPGMENYRQTPRAAVHFRVPATEPLWEVSEQRPQGLILPPAVPWERPANSQGQRMKQGVRKAGCALSMNSSRPSGSPPVPIPNLVFRDATAKVLSPNSGHRSQLRPPTPCSPTLSALKPVGCTPSKGPCSSTTGRTPRLWARTALQRQQNPL